MFCLTWKFKLRDYIQEKILMDANVTDDKDGIKSYYFTSAELNSNYW